MDGRMHGRVDGRWIDGSIEGMLAQVLRLTNPNSILEFDNLGFLNTPSYNT